MISDLKELVVCVKPESGLKKLSEDPPFISMVSVRFALEMMPNLGVKFVYEDFYYDHRKIAGNLTSNSSANPRLFKLHPKGYISIVLVDAIF